MFSARAGFDGVELLWAEPLLALLGWEQIGDRSVKRVMTESYAIWSIWTQLAWSHRLYWLVLALTALYVVLSVLATLVRLHSLKRHDQDDLSARSALLALQHRCQGLRQLLTATLCLFGFVFFAATPRALCCGEGPLPESMRILLSFFLFFAFAANVFAVHFILHVMQWFASSRVNTFARRRGMTAR